MSLAQEYDRWHQGIFDSAPEHPDESTPWYKLVLEFLTPVQSKRILEVACGRGGFSRLLASKGATVCGADFSESAIKIANEKLAREPASADQLSYVQADAQSLPFDEASFDIVISCETIEHVPDHRAAVREMYRVCKPGGLLYLTTPNYLNFMGLYLIYAKMRHPGFKSDQPLDKRYLFPQVWNFVTSAGWKITRTDGTMHQFPFIPGRNPVQFPSVESNRTIRKLLSPFAYHYLVVAQKGELKAMTANSMRVVVIGGAGFIGSHLVDALVGDGFHVSVVDNLDAQVHLGGQLPAYLNPHAEFIRRDVRDRDGLQKAIEGAEAVFHLAGAVGVGDSMYRIRHYAETNVVGGANLLDILANTKHSVRKIILASSVTVYGEGKYSCPVHGVVFPSVRTMEKGVNRRWDLQCPVSANAARCGEKLSPLPTDEEKPATPQSIYAITKRTQEELFLAFGRAYGIPVAVLRYFNVYGSRQALSNPYTGVAKIFALHFAQGKVPLIYEDGHQSRDFIHVSDVVRANILALTRDESAGEIFNVGTGQPTSIVEMARAVARKFGNRAVPEPSNQFRAGDVRHCWADSTKIRAKLGFEPRRMFPAGLEDVVAMEEAVRGPAQTAVEHDDLVQRGLVS